MNKAKTLIFLDIDGVISTPAEYGAPRIDKYGYPFNVECLRKLEYILQETGALIVISSSWKFFGNLDLLRSLFETRGFKYCFAIIGKTPNLSEPSRIRGDEIKRYLEINDTIFKGWKYVILDDDSDMLESQLSRLVQVKGHLGLQNEDVDKVIKLLLE